MISFNWKLFTVEPAKPLAGGNTCALWGGEHIYTFDGALITSSGRCHYQIVKDCHSNSFVMSMYYSDNGVPALRISNDDMVVELSNGGATFNGESYVTIIISFLIQFYTSL